MPAAEEPAMTDAVVPRWAYASLTLVQPSWPGTRGAEWVARVAGAERFRSTDVHEAMDRLGSEGWELVTLFPEQGDRAASFWFKVRRGPAG
jgi:hypothetical protein